MLTDDREFYFASDKKPKIDIDETVKKFKYLLGVTDLFRHFLDLRAAADPAFAEVVRRIDSSSVPEKSVTHRRRKTEKEEDAELLLDEKRTARIPEFSELPGYIQGTLRSYQVQGLNWLIGLYENNISGILADEMGLGKTLQTISLLGYLRHCRGVRGPHIIITPKLTLDNWKREFSRWTPEVNVLVLQGTKDERNDTINNQIMRCAFDVIITSYEIVIREKSTFKKFDWQYIVIDEAHRIKNEQSMLSQIIRLFHLKHRLLITGTPLQNNLHELWALLNFILPDVFGDSDAFDAWFTRGDENALAPEVEVGESTEVAVKAEGETQKDDAAQGTQNSVISQLHKVLQPFLLRRIKSDVEKSLLPKQEMNVYIGMSDMQRKWYQKLLEKDLDAVNGANGKKESKTRLLNIVMQLRKCCNHPYLFEGAEPGPPYTTDEHIVHNSQKMIILDKLLNKLRGEGSRVLIFSQMSRMLDILEDYCGFRGYEYCRIDGQTDHADRVRHIDEYNAPGLSKFVFLLTTRAGGLGINLTTADTVILFDSDWNPQADLQAMDRAHRIGQTKQVKVFRLITLNAVEEKILERATQKLRLDQLVIQDAGKRQGGSSSLTSTSKDQLLDMIQFGAADIFNNKDNPSQAQDDLDIEAILRDSQSKTQELTHKYAKLDLSALQNFSNDGSVYEWNGENFKKKEPNSLKNVGHAWINPAKRERKENYSVDLYYKDVMSSGKGSGNNDDPNYDPNYTHTSSSSAPHVKGGPRPPKQLNIYDHQFHPPKLMELHELEKNYYKKRIDFEPQLESGPPLTLAARQQAQKLAEEEIRNSRLLTEEERELKLELLTQGFNSWNRRDFIHFVALSAKYGRNALSLISSEFEEKTLEEVREYAQVFWKRYKEIDGYERYIAQVEAGEDKIEKMKISKECLRRKLLSYKYPLQELVLKYPPATTTKRTFTDEEDRFMLIQMYKYGLDRPDLYERIRDLIKLSGLLRFDFFMHLRSTAELSRRCNSLIACVLKEINPEMAAANKSLKQEKKRKSDETPKKRKKSKLK